MTPIDHLKFIHRTRNWGDYLSPYVFRKLTGRKAKRVPMLEVSRRPHYLTVGSVLRMADDHSVVWGSGFIDHDDGIGLMHWREAHNEKLHVPREVCAVRGPLTRQKLLSLGIDCPEIYGDPALLMPLFYRPRRAKPKYRLGFIPHYTDLHAGVTERWRLDPRVKVISMLKSRLEQIYETDRTYERVVDELLSCEFVASGSLHGLILADAYGIPNRWVRVNRHNIGDGFKYLDYFGSVGRADVAPIELNDDSRVEDVLDRIEKYEIRFDPEALLRACPFGTAGLRHRRTPSSAPPGEASSGPHLPVGGPDPKRWRGPR